MLVPLDRRDSRAGQHRGREAHRGADDRQRVRALGVHVRRQEVAQRRFHRRHVPPARPAGRPRARREARTGATTGRIAPPPRAPPSPGSARITASSRRVGVPAQRERVGRIVGALAGATGTMLAHVDRPRRAGPGQEPCASAPSVLEGVVYHCWCARRGRAGPSTLEVDSRAPRPVTPTSSQVRCGRRSPTPSHGATVCTSAGSLPRRLAPRGGSWITATCRTSCSRRGARWSQQLVEPAAAQAGEVERHPAVARASTAATTPRDAPRPPDGCSGTSMRATSSWWRTRSSVNPRARNAASARSTELSRPRVTGVPYGSRDARQAAAGLSHVTSPSSFDQVRTSALVNPASTSGKAAPRSVAARWPGRWSSRSSRLTPRTTVAPRSARPAGQPRPCSASLHQ